MGFLSVPNLVPWWISQLELSLISFAGSESSSTWQGGDKKKRRWREGWGVIILRSWFLRIFLSKGGNYYSRDVINQGTTIPVVRQPFSREAVLHFFLSWSNMWIPDRNYSQFAQFPHNTLCWPPKVLHSLCVSFPLGITVIAREIEGNAHMQNFGGQTRLIMEDLQMENWWIETLS